MRLICPNCGAQYEVPDDVIPENGRDVQCSNCGNTWFQHHPDNDPDLSDELDRLDDLAPQPPEPAPEPEQPRRRSLDPSVADILREEAEHEARARAADQTGLETQPDLGLNDAPEEPLDEAGKRARQARDRMARMRGITTPEPAIVEDAPSSRRDLLPDIEEINSSLRQDGASRPAGADDHTLAGDAPQLDVRDPGRRGFRRGFSIALLLAAVLWALYVFAPQLGNLVPQAKPVLASYIDAVNQARSALDAQVQVWLSKLDQMSSGS